MKQPLEITSIFEGLMPSALFGGEHQYLMGIGIDPDVPLTDAGTDIKTGGCIRPVQYSRFSGDEIDALPIEVITTPQSDITWVVLANGKIVAYKDTLTSANSYSIGQVAGSYARGAFYYNNYIYITGTGANKNDVSRIGPLNTLPYDARSANFTVGQIVTGATSGAVGMIVDQIPTASRSPSSSLSPSASPSLSPSASLSPSSSISPSVSPPDSFSPSKSPSKSPSLSPSISPSVSPSPSLGFGAGEGTLILSQISGVFLDDEVITDAGGGSATVNRSFSSLIADGVWTGATLGSQDELGNAPYPKTILDTAYLNHFGFAHSDGAAYFLDFQNTGIGYIHKIQTTKLHFQGDTNDGSAFGSVGALSLPADYVPITAVSYGTDIVISGSRTVDGTINQGNAYLFFWDAAEELFYRAIKLPDTICTILKYVNGTLYGLSGDINGGYRLWRYVGGDAIETLKIIEDGYLPLQGSADFVGNRLVWGANTTLPLNSSGLYAYGSKSDLFPRGLHHIARSDFS